MEFYMIMWWLLAIIATLVLLSSIDELILDIAYLIAFMFHQYKIWLHHYKHLTLEQICSVPEKKIAIMVGCWSEHLVIEDMLRHNIQAIDYQNYDFFVGVYPNDNLTIQAVARAQKEFGNIIAIVNKAPGPSTKADNLNNVYKNILAIEKERNVHYEIILFHDAEDVIHPLALKLYNYLLPRKDMIQTPVIPLEVSHTFTTHWTYNDEFAENHTKIMLAREIIGGLVTSAGVGTAFSRSAIEKLVQKTGGTLFEVNSLTEDYHISLEIHLLKLKSIFLTQRILRTQMKKKWYFFGKLIPKKTYELVATRALFPSRYLAAVRQRARWITGIALQEWRNIGWPGTLATRYTLLHDRKILATHFIGVMAYLIFIYWLIYYLIGAEPTISTLLKLHPAVYYIIIVCTIMLIIRLLYHAWASYKIYGVVAALLSIPRTVCSNIINFHALLRAYRGFFSTPQKEAKWDKTNNTFPSKAILKKYTKKLGDLLLENKIITTEQLREALLLQKTSHDKLGKILISKYAIRPEQIALMLGKQFNIEVVDHNKFPTLTHQEINFMTIENYNWLIKNQIYPVSFFENSIILALINPANEHNNDEAILRLKPYKVKFVLLSDTV